MAYSTAEARQQLLDTLAKAAEDLGLALALLTDAYEQLDEQSADALEQALFKPVQSAYGRAKRTHAEFAARHGLATREFEPAGKGAPSRGIKRFLDRAADAVASADSTLGALQDSMLPVEVGDQPLRAGIEEVRVLIDHFRAHARDFVRTLGR